MNGVCAICKLDHVGPAHFHTDGHRNKQAIVERREDREDPQLRLLPDTTTHEQAVVRRGHDNVGR